MHYPFVGSLKNERDTLADLFNKVEQKLPEQRGILHRIGAPRGGEGLISLDEYGKHDVKLHLYCSMRMEFSLGIKCVDEEGEMNESIFKLVGDDLLAIPDGLKKLMEIAVSTDKIQVFTTNLFGGY